MRLLLKKSRKKVLGLSLLEMMVAMTLMMMVLIAFAGVYPTGLRAHRIADVGTRSLEFAKGLSEEFKTIPLFVTPSNNTPRSLTQLTATNGANQFVWDRLDGDDDGTWRALFPAPAGSNLPPFPRLVPPSFVRRVEVRIDNHQGLQNFNTPGNAIPSSSSIRVVVEYVQSANQANAPRPTPGAVAGDNGIVGETVVVMSGKASNRS